MIKQTDITIKKAFYGRFDVTEILQKLIDDNKFPIAASNVNFGEPSLGSTKTLSLDYIENGIEKHLDVKENDAIPFNLPIFEFIIPTYNRVKPLYSMLASLVAQTKDNWKATIVVDDVENDRVKEIVSKFNSDKISYMFLGKRYNDFGHTPRNVGKQASTSDYIILTGDDNYYVPSFIHELTQVVSNNNYYGMIYWDMIHNGYEYKYFNTRTQDGYIDMGGFATRRDLAQQIQLVTHLLTADSFFVLEFMKKFPEEKIVKIEKILFVHN